MISLRPLRVPSRQSGFIRRSLVAVFALLCLGGFCSSASAADILAASFGDGSISSYGKFGSYRGTFASPPGSCATDLAMGPDGLLYVSYYYEGVVARFNPGSGALVDTLPIAHAYGLAFGPDGMLYVGSPWYVNVRRYNPATKAYLGEFASGEGDFRFIAFGPDGNLYGVSYGYCVSRWDGSTGAPMPAVGQGGAHFIYPVASTAYSISFGPDGNLYVGNFGSNNGGYPVVQRFSSATGAFMDDFVPANSGGAFRAEGIRFGPDGNLYVADRTSVVYRFDGHTGAPLPAAGKLGAVFITGINGCSRVEFRGKADPAPGNAFAWGNNDYGMLGDGTTNTSRTPIPVSGLDSMTGLSGGYIHSLGVKQDGTAWSWGANGSGELGDGTTTPRLSPVQISGLTNVASVAAGFWQSYALRDDGTVWAWGYNGVGELGDGTSTDRHAPVQVSGLTDVVAIASGWDHGMALRSDGTVWTWGNNEKGQLGDGTTTIRWSPVQASGLTNVIAIGGGKSHSIALRSDGTVWAWGYNFNNQLGDGTGIDHLTPVQVSNLAGVVAIVAGGQHNIALKSDGTLRSWGLNDMGQLGNLGGLTDVVAIAAGYLHSMALRSDGTVYGWGYNGWGQLGNGTVTTTGIPVQVTNLSNAKAIACGIWTTFAVVGKQGPTQQTSLAVSNVTGEIGQTVTLSATLTRTSDGQGLGGRSITLKIDGTEVAGSPATTDVGGTATASYTLPTGSAGPHIIDAAFAGDDVYIAASGSATLSTSLIATTVKPEDASGIVGETVTLSAKFTRTTTGAALNGKSLTFKVDGAEIAGSPATTDAGGVASISYTIPAGSVGSHTLAVSFAGEGDFAASSGSSNLTVNKDDTALSVPTVVGYPGQTVTISATLTRTLDGAPLSGRTLSFKVGATTIGNGTTGPDGKASVGYTIPTNATVPGSLSITVSFAGDGDDNPISVNGALNVRKQTTITVTAAKGIIGKAVTLKATLVSGKTKIKGATITFSINGKVVGSAVTGTTGIAQLASVIVPEHAGAQTITATFGGDATYAPVSANGTLTAQQANSTTTADKTAISAPAGSTVVIGATLVNSSAVPPTPVSGKPMTCTGQPNGVTDGAGHVSFSIKAPAKGKKATFTITFPGDGDYKTSKSKTISVTGT